MRIAGSKGRWILLVGLFWGMSIALGQFGTPSGQIRPQSGPGQPPEDPGPSVIRDMQAHQLKRLRAEHQKQVMQDIERLVQLAAAVKADVEKGDPASLEALKSVDEIGKLAKRISERIKTQ